MINKRVPRILYGGDYNPDQWSENVWKEDMRLFKLAHINFVTLPVFSWAKLQPSEEQYDFGWLDKIMDLLWANGIYVCLATSTAAQPAWMSRKYPEMLPVDIAGRKRTHGKRVNFCPNSETYRTFSVRLAGKLAAHYKDHPALLVWHVANEYGTYCYCDRCAAAFRQWARERYGTLEELNKRWNLSFWGHTIYDWEEITLPTELNEDDTCNPAVALDYRRFMTDSTLACYLGEYRAIKAVTPDIPVTTNMSGYIKKLDQFRFSERLDVVGWDNYPSPTDDPSTVALKHDLMRGLKRAPYLMVEQSPNQQNWQPYNKLKRPGEVRRLSYQAVAHGAESVMYFQLRQSVGGVEKLHGALISSAGHENTRVFRECAQIGEELEKLGGALVDAEYRAQAAIVFDWDNWWSVELSSGPSRDLKYFEQVNKYYKAFYDRNIPVDIVKPDADFSQYRVVVLPLYYMVKSGNDLPLKEFVRSGGTAVCTCFSGIVDENDRIAAGGYPGALRELLGIWVEETDALLPGERNSIQMRRPRGKLQGSYACGLLCDLVHPQGAQTLAVYGSDFYADTACLTVNACGKGKAYYVATDPEEPFLDDFVDLLCAENGMQAPLSAPKHVEVVRRYKEGRVFTLIINHNAHPVCVELDGRHRNLLGGEELSDTADVAPGDVLILEKEDGS